MRMIGVQLLDFCCSSVSVRVLLLSTHLVSTQFWILNNMFAVLMHIINYELKVLHADRITCMFMNHSRT